MNKYLPNDHCFVICAYKESPFLEDCIKSLNEQTIKTNILIETSTPNIYIDTLAKKYNIKVIVNNGEGGCSQDWNYAFEHCPHKLITIAHQDDIYYSEYSKNILKYANDTLNPILFYTNYCEIRGNRIVLRNINLIIKRILNHHMLNKNNWSKYKSKRKVLFLGNAISCPTVTMVKEKVGNRPYDDTYKCSCDYKTWTNLLNIQGEYVYIPTVLTAHRIYSDSHTTLYLETNIRQNEDKEILSTFWRYPFNKIIYFLYSFSQKSNKL